MAGDVQLPDQLTMEGLARRLLELEQKVTDAQRSSTARQLTVSGGAGITINDLGALRLVDNDGQTIFYVGPLGETRPDGEPQPGIAFFRDDGSFAFALYDNDIASGGYQQFWSFWDRQVNIVMSDDADSGQGLARPYIPGGFYRDRFADWLGVAGTTFETVYKATIFKQHPKLVVGHRSSMDTGGATGEIRVLVNGSLFGTVQSIGFGLGSALVGPLAVPGGHMSAVTVEIQARRTAGTGSARVEPYTLYGVQS